MRVAALKKPALVLFFLVFVLVAGGCEKKNQYVAPPPAPVTVALPVQKDVVDYIEFTGTTQAVASVDIRARVQGFLESIHFREGAIINKGDLLYIIDPKPYQAAVDKAAAELESKKAQLERAEVEYQRNLRLMKENATSEKELNNAKTSRDAAKADVGMAAAGLDTAKINLGYTTIRSPLAGRTGRSQVDIGNLVGAGEFTLLTTIKQFNPIYAYFTVNEQDLLRVMKMQRAEGGEGARHVPVQMGLVNESGYPHEGEIDFADLGVDQATGTFLLRGVFQNPSRPPVLIPGLFVRLRAPIGIHANAVLVPERAIGVDQLGKYVLVVNNDNVVEYRPLKLGIQDGQLREIHEGVKAGDKVIVSGIQRARPGAKVNPSMAEPQSAAAARNPSN